MKAVTCSQRNITVSNSQVRGVRLTRSRSLIVASLLLALSAFPALPCKNVAAQGKLPNKVHYLLGADEAPGVVASAQVARGARGVGSFQPLSISGPDGLQVGLAKDGQFLPQIDAPVTTAMLVGAVYRFRVSNIPFRPGAELYPTVEVIDRVYAPAGREHRFPIPVVLTEEDLRLALSGALVTRVVYLEDGEIADPIAMAPGEQNVRNVHASDNALQVADQLGRPVAIVRIGSRVPMNLYEDLTGFLYGCPPWLPLAPVPTREALVQDGMWPEIAPVIAKDEIFSEAPTEDSPRVEMPDAGFIE